MILCYPMTTRPKSESVPYYYKGGRMKAEEKKAEEKKKTLVRKEGIGESVEVFC